MTAQHDTSVPGAVPSGALPRSGSADVQPDGNSLPFPPRPFRASESDLRFGLQREKTISTPSLLVPSVVAVRAIRVLGRRRCQRQAAPRLPEAGWPVFARASSARVRAAPARWPASPATGFVFPCAARSLYPANGWLRTLSMLTFSRLSRKQSVHTRTFRFCSSSISSKSVHPVPAGTGSIEPFLSPDPDASKHVGRPRAVSSVRMTTSREARPTPIAL